MAAKKTSSKTNKKTGSKTKTAKTKKSTTAPIKKGRQPKKDGLEYKKRFVVVNFVNKGKTRPQAIAGLLKKYPDMSENYAKTIAYTYLKDEDWTPAKRASKKSVPAASSKKKNTEAKSKSKTKPTKKRRQPANEIAADDDAFDDFDF